MCVAMHSKHMINIRLQCIANPFLSQALGEQYEMPWLACAKAGASVVMKSELKASEVHRYQDLVSHFVFVLSLSNTSCCLNCVCFFLAGRE